MGSDTNRSGRRRDRYPIAIGIIVACIGLGAVGALFCVLYRALPGGHSTNQSAKNEEQRMGPGSPVIGSLMQATTPFLNPSAEQSTSFANPVGSVVSSTKRDDPALFLTILGHADSTTTQLPHATATVHLMPTASKRAVSFDPALQGDGSQPTATQPDLNAEIESALASALVAAPSSSDACKTSKNVRFYALVVLFLFALGIF